MLLLYIFIVLETYVNFEQELMFFVYLFEQNNIA